ncbi:MAG: YggT family protein [Nitrospinae bacterium]|nr:YggT family protein [Nitrospinota bacterium]
MYVIGNFFIAAGQVIGMVLSLYVYVVIARALISWVNPDPYNPIVQFLNRITEPVLRPIQKAIPPMGGLDLSPLILIFGIYFVKMFAVTTLVQFGYNLSGGGAVGM